MAFWTTPAFAAGIELEGITFDPIEHASMVIRASGTTIYVDPIGPAEAFAGFPKPDLILVTHGHYDHFKPEFLETLRGKTATLIGPDAIVKQLGWGEVMKNGETRKVREVGIEAVPAYNLTPERLKFHEKGIGNGYVLTLGEKRIYVSGDTEDVPEMRGLKNIDVAFVCMNLPYTMTVEKAAEAVLEMKPGTVIPYHYRCQDGFSDIEAFKRLVGKKSSVTVRFFPWYK